MRSGRLILVSMLGLLACSEKHASTDGGGGQAGTATGAAGATAGAAGTGTGAAGATAGAAGSIGPSGAAGTGSGGASGGSGAAGQAGGGRGGIGAAGAGGDAPGGSTGAGGIAGSGGAAGTGGAGGRAGGGGTGGTSAAGAGGNAAGGTAGAGGIGGSGGATGGGGAGGQAGASGPPGLRLLAGGLGGPGTVDGVGASARFTSPYSVASDGAGNVYVAEMTAGTIRKVVVATGAVTTLAGAPGQFGTADGTGASARFSSPYAVAGDGAGNLYVADSGNHTIRKIVITTGAVTTLAGPTGFYAPCGIAFDGAGNLYVTDQQWGDIQSHIYIRKVVIATGAVTAIADWLTIGAVNGPFSITSDGAGNVYLPDNDTIRKVVVATGAVTTLAGAEGQPGSTDGTGAAARFSGPSAVAGDGTGNLYVADTGNSTIRKVVIATGAVTTVAGSAGQGSDADGTGAAAGFNGAYGIASDGAGNLFVGDVYNTAIRKIVIATGAVTTLAGAARKNGSADGTGAAARFSYPSAIAGDGAGNLYVADPYNHTIRKIVVATGAVTTLAGAAGQEGNADGTGAQARFGQPTGIVGDGAGNLYVADGIIRKIVIATGTVTTVTNGPGHLPSEGGPAGIASDGAGNLYFFVAGGLWKVAIATGDLTSVVSGLTFGSNGMVSDGAGHLFVADTYTRIVWKIDLATGIADPLAGARDPYASPVDGTGAAARFANPDGLAIDGAGNLFVADGRTIRKIVIATGTVSTIIGSPDRAGVSLGPLPASLSGAHGVVVLPNGELSILETNENAVLIGHL